MTGQFEFDESDSLWFRYTFRPNGNDTPKEEEKELAVWFGGFGFTDPENHEKHPRYHEFVYLIQELGAKVFSQETER